MSTLARAMSNTRAEAKQASVDRMAELLSIAGSAALADSDTPPRPGDMVWYALKEAMDTLGRLPDRESGWIYCLRSSHPEMALDHKDALEAFETMVQRLAMGEVAYEELDVKRPPSPRAISRMEIVFDWYKLLRGKSRRRDWKILCLLATGMTASRVARIVRCSKSTVHFQRDSQCSAIATALRRDYGDIFPEGLV